MIKIFIIGRLGKDCSTNNVSGNNVINFSVAHSERYKDSAGNQKERTIWAECAYWTDKQGVVPYLKKGTQVYVEGAPDVRSYTTNDGKHGASLVVRVQSVQLLGSKNDNDDNSNSSDNASFSAPINNFKSSSSNNNGSGADLDDLPF